MPNSPIRTLLVGLQNVDTVLAATMRNLSFNTINSPDLFARTKIPIHNGTVNGDIRIALGSRATDVSLNVSLELDQVGWFLASAFGSPTTTPVSGASGAFDHVFKLGPATAPKRLSLQIYNGVRWKQIIGAAVNTTRILVSAEEPPNFQFEMLCPAATNISAPTPGAMTFAFARPAGSRELAVSIAAASAFQRTGTIEINNNLQRYYTSDNGANVRRLKRGRPTVMLDANVDYTDYTGSFKEDYDTEENLGEYIAKWLFSDLLIGTGTPVPASATLTIPSSVLDNAEEPDDGPEAEQHVTGEAKYDATAATKAYFTLRNTTAAYTAD